MEAIDFTTDAMASIVSILFDW